MRSRHRLARAALLMLGLGGGLTASAADVDSERCFDAAVVVRLVHQEEGALIDDPSDLIGHAVFHLTFRTEQIVYSRIEVPRRTFTVSFLAHGPMIPAIRDLLVFLRREDHGLSLRWLEADVTRDERGRWVRPVMREEIADDFEGETPPQHWVPKDFQAYLVPLRYRTEDAWWKRQLFDQDGKPVPLSALPKHTEEKGFVLTGMRDYFARLADQKCN